MSNRTATWKSHERRLAAKLGGQRLGATGKTNEDVSTDTLAVECKHRQQLPAWFTEPVRLIREHAKKQGKTGVVCWHELGRHDSLIVISLADFVALTGQKVSEQQPEAVERDSMVVRETIIQNGV